MRGSSRRSVPVPLLGTGITVAATDHHSNFSSATSSVHVVDTTAPAFAGVLATSATVALDPAGAVVTLSS